MRKISIVTVIAFLCLYTISCTPEVLAEDEYIELQATEGDDGDVTPPPPPPPPLPPGIEG
jgi:hypothetical protein